MTLQALESYLPVLVHEGKYGIAGNGGNIRAADRKCGSDCAPGPYTSGVFPVSAYMS